MRYYMIAGEASGDLHGSNLVKGLRQCDPDAEIRCWGGPLMAQAGAELVHDYKDGAVMGVSDVLRKAGSLLGNIRKCRQDILSWHPDVVILIDYPGFNLKIAEFAHKAGLKVFWYIAPKTWASRSGRNAKLKEYVDRLFIVFPFEIPYFEAQGIPFIYKGNPLIDAVAGHEYRRPVEDRYIAILAGSRKGEISRMMPVCMETADRLRQTDGFRDCRFVIAGAPSRSMEDYAQYIGDARKDYVDVLFGRTYDILRYADAAVINSGTASLEAALIGTPQVVGWSTSAVTIFVAKHILKVGSHIKYISLANLISDKPIFRELIQNDFNADTLCAEIDRLVNDSGYRARMEADYEEMRLALGGQGSSVAVAKAMTEALKD